MENDLEKMKKTMPYTVPERFFDRMEERLMQETVEKAKPSNLRKVALWTGFAVAASLPQKAMKTRLSKWKRHSTNSVMPTKRLFLTIMMKSNILTIIKTDKL